MPTKEEEEGGNIPHLTSSKRNDPTCLNFGDCLVVVWSGWCWEIVWKVSGPGCSGQAKSGQVKLEDMSGLDRSSQLGTG